MKHATLTGSRYAESLLADWASVQRRMVKVMPREYKRALAEQARKRADDARRPERDVVVVTVAAAASTPTHVVRT
jgi:glutamate synthase (NADPH/NADH) large chain